MYLRSRKVESQKPTPKGKNKFGIPDKDYPDDIVVMKRIEKICKDPTIDSRFIGEGDLRNEPMIIMAFLPQNNIDKIPSTKEFL